MEVSNMWIWIIAIVAILGILGLFEWRSRNKPLARGLDGVNAHSAAHNGEGRTMSGGHDNS